MSIEVFTFGDPVPVMERRELLDYLECPVIGKWYETPLPWESLSRTYRATAHHPSALQVKRNILSGTYIPHKWLPRSVFTRFIQDYLIFGNAYLVRKDNRLGTPLALDAPLAKYVRRGADLSTYYYVPVYNREHAFASGSVFHLMQHDINQEVYGIPEYLGALNATWLNEAATLFRRKYYRNGSHAGFIMYMTDPSQKEDDIKALKSALKNAKGPGNFRNLFLHSPGGPEKGVQIIPISEVVAKDEFWNIKNSTRDDQLAAHRVPPQLIGIVPNNTGGFGDVEKAARVFSINEIFPLQEALKELNTWIGDEVIRFNHYMLEEKEK